MFAILSQHDTTALDTIAFNAVISACEKGSQWEYCFHFFDRMRCATVHADSITFNAVISACHKGSQWALSLDLISEADQRGYRPAELGIVGLSAAAASCEQEGLMAQAELLRATIRRSAVPSKAPSVVGPRADATPDSEILLHTAADEDCATPWRYRAHAALLRRLRNLCLDGRGLTLEQACTASSQPASTAARLRDQHFEIVGSFGPNLARSALHHCAFAHESRSCDEGVWNNLARQDISVELAMAPHAALMGPERKSLRVWLSLQLSLPRAGAVLTKS